MSSPLSALRDIVGVEGSLLIASGHLIARDLPFVSPDDCMAAANRLDLMLATIDENLQPVEILTMTFDGLEVFVRRAGELALIVLLSPKANREAVKMASKLTLRRIPGPKIDPTNSEPLPNFAPPSTSSFGVAPLLPQAPPPGVTPTGPFPAFVPNASRPRPEKPTPTDARGSTTSRQTPKKKSDIWG